MRSPHLVCGDFFEQAQEIGFIQMEKIDGINLHRFLQSGQHRGHRQNDVFFNYYNGRPCVQPGVVVYIMRQILAGLEKLHAAGYLHCDIKPSNIMIDPLGYIRVIDLGRAQESGESRSPIIGTPHYAAPELHLGKPATIQSDIYSVGLVGLELLSGQRIFPEKRPTQDSLGRRKRQLYDSLRRYLPPYVSCNQELVSIFEHFLAPDPKNRYASAANAEVCGGGLATVHKQLTRMDIDSDYRRELSHLLYGTLRKNKKTAPTPGATIETEDNGSTTDPPTGASP